MYLAAQTADGKVRPFGTAEVRDASALPNWQQFLFFLETFNLLFYSKILSA
jgi:hypothetical protein